MGKKVPCFYAKCESCFGGHATAFTSADMSKQRKSVHDERLVQASVNELDPDLLLVASQAAMLLGRSKTRMDSDRRDGRPPIFYRDGRKVLYRLGDVLAERARIHEIAKEDAPKNAIEKSR